MMWTTGANSQESQGIRADSCYENKAARFVVCTDKTSLTKSTDEGSIMARDDITRQGRAPATGTNEEYGPHTWVHIGVAARAAFEKAKQMKALREAAYSRKVLDKKGFAP